MIMEKAVCTLGSINLRYEDKNQLITNFVCPTFDRHLSFIYVATS